MNLLRLSALIVLVFFASSGGALAQTSLFNPATYKSMYADGRPYREGQLITVMVYETSSATSNADTTANRDANITGQINGTTKSRSGLLQTGNQFDGHGQTQRSGKLLAQITVTITSILPNGELVVAGEQFVEINREKQQIRIEGLVRPEDVTDKNTVQSTRLANAKISYLGEGDLMKHNAPSWWQNFLLWFGV